MSPAISSKKNYTVINKQEARAIGRKDRMALSPEDYLSHSMRIAKQLETVLGEQGLHIHVYQALAKNFEVSTQPVIAYLQNQLHPIELHVQSRNPTFPATQYDAIVLPCLAVDRTGNRVGYGGGHYDRFLARQPRAQKIVLCFSGQIIEDGIRSERHDQPVDVIVSENEIIYCG